MHKSKEIRWFSREIDQRILQWFNKREYYFSETPARTDYYMPTPHSDLGIKLREGRIEAKQRLGEPRLMPLKEGVQGYLEHWVKWSFGLSTDQILVKRMLTENQDINWIGVYKERLGLNLNQAADGAYRVTDMGGRMALGCQIEYTRIQIRQEVWYSFALEFFGETRMDLPLDFLDELLGETLLSAENSMGYPAFLIKHYQA